MKKYLESVFLSTKKILIIEDDIFTAKLIKESLQTLGYKVLDIVSSGEEAIKKAKSMNFDLVLMDSVLNNKIRDFETTEKTRTFFDIPVIYIAAYSRNKTLERAMENDPYGYIVKPFKGKELHTAIMITLYKHKMQKKLRESKELFRAVFEAVPDLLSIKNLDLRYIKVNPAMGILFNMEPEEFIGKTDIDLFGEETAKHLMAVDQQIIKGEIIEDEITEHINGVWHTFHITKVPFRDSDENILGLLSITRDITNRKKAEAALKKAHDNLEFKVEERTQELKILHNDKNQFISRASHNLRTPIASILGFTQLLVKGKWGDLNKDQLERLEKIENHAQRLNSIVSDLLSISQIEARAIRVKKDVVNISDLIKSVITEMSVISGAKFQSIEFKAPDLPVFVLGDPDSIDEILINLIENSIVYSKNNQKIMITLEKDDLKCIIRVKDWGIGLTQEDQKHVFTEFYRVVQKKEEQSQGTGLGLAIVKKLVIQMKGNIWVESEGINKGSTFSFSLPVIYK